MSTAVTHPVSLIVEDEPLLQRAIALKLETRGIHAEVVGTVDDALAHIDRGARYDAIWLDHYLPGAMNGLDFMDRLHTHPAYAHVPIFVVSNTASSEKRAKYLELGARAFFVKADNSIDDIVQAVDKAVRVKA